jgi:hypothetical protein
MDIISHFILICLIIITSIMMVLVQNHIFVIMSKSLVVFHIGHKGVSWRNLWVFEVFGGLIDLHVGFPSPSWFFILIVQIYPSKVCGVFSSLVGS